MNTVYAIKFKNYLHGSEVDSENPNEQPNNKILDNKIYMNVEDAIFALESIIDNLSLEEERHFESGMYEYTVDSYELI
jgi:predicted SAM-dependent methyltransferase